MPRYVLLLIGNLHLALTHELQRTDNRYNNRISYTYTLHLRTSCNLFTKVHLYGHRNLHLALTHELQPQRCTYLQDACTDFMCRISNCILQFTLPRVNATLQREDYAHYLGSKTLSRLSLNCERPSIFLELPVRTYFLFL